MSLSATALSHPLDVTITALTDKGDGIGELDGRTLYVSGALPGERVQVRLHGIKPKYAQGELLAVLQPSPDRVANFCPHMEIRILWCVCVCVWVIVCVLNGSDVRKRCASN